MGIYTFVQKWSKSDFDSYYLKLNNVFSVIDYICLMQ